MRNMSFSLTKEAIKSRTKFVTRRLGWESLKPSDLFQAVEKAQGLKRGEHVKPLGLLRCDSNVSQALNAILNPWRRKNGEYIQDQEAAPEEVKLEGFEGLLTPNEFVEMFCDHNDCDPDTQIQRIQFSYVIEVEDSFWASAEALIQGREIEWEAADRSRYNAFIVLQVDDNHYRLKSTRDGSGGKINTESIKKIFISA